MSDVAAGLPVPENQLAMNLQQGGLEPDRRAVPPTRTPPGTLNLAIIGAGMTGLDAAVKAADRGFDFEVYEMESGAGGLWGTLDEVADLKAAGVDVVLIHPDERASAAIGVNVFDPARRGPAAEAGRTQGQGVATEVLKVWESK
jgi:hypothetical protein